MATISSASSAVSTPATPRLLPLPPPVLPPPVLPPPPALAAPATVPPAPDAASAASCFMRRALSRESSLNLRRFWMPNSSPSWPLEP